MRILSSPAVSFHGLSSWFTCDINLLKPAQKHKTLQNRDPSRGVAAGTKHLRLQVVRARRRHQNLRVHVEALELTTPIDAEPLRKGMHAWLHSDSGQESEPFGFGHFGQLECENDKSRT